MDKVVSTDAFKSNLRCCYVMATLINRVVAGLLQGLTLAHFTAQLEDFQDTSLTLELNLSTFGTHPWVKLGYMGDKVS
jgi:hypothetical protein